MKYLKISSVVLASSLVLAACGEDVANKEDKKSEETTESTKDNSQKKDDKKKDKKDTPELPSDNEMKKLKESDDNLLKDVKIKKSKTYNVPGEELINEPAVDLSDYIEVEPETEYIKYHGGHVFYFDKDKERIDYKALEIQGETFKTPKGTAYIQVSIPVVNEGAEVIVPKK